MGRPRRGFTLIEALVALVVLGVLGVGAMLILVLGVNTTNTIAISAATDTQAGLMLREIVSDLRQGMSLTVTEADRLEIALPQVDADGNNVLPLQVGDHVSYYLSDSGGDPASEGTNLWRATRAVGETLPTPQRILIEDVTSLEFAYIPDSANAEAVRLSIVARGKSGARTAQMTHTRMVRLRNFGL